MQPNELTTAGSTMGTVSYMSPEQARGQVTDALPGQMPIEIVIRGLDGSVRETVRRLC